MQTTLLVLLIALISVSFSNCNQRVSKPPAFKDGGTTLNDLKSIYQFENIEFENWEEDDLKDSSLTVCLINSKSIPANGVDENVEQLKGIASKIKNSLKTPELYKSYYVIFVTRQGTGLGKADSHTMGMNINARDL